MVGCNEAQHVCISNRCDFTNLTNKEKPLLDNEDFPKGKMRVINYTHS